MGMAASSHQEMAQRMMEKYRKLEEDEGDEY